MLFPLDMLRGYLDERPQPGQEYADVHQLGCVRHLHPLQIHPKHLRHRLREMQRNYGQADVALLPEGVFDSSGVLEQSVVGYSSTNRMHWKVDSCVEGRASHLQTSSRNLDRTTAVGSDGASAWL